MKFGKGGNPTPTGSVWGPLDDPRPFPASPHSPRTQSSDMAEAPASFRRTPAAPPHPAAPSFLSAGAAAAPAIGPTGLTVPHGPGGRQCPAALSDPRQFSPSDWAPNSCEYGWGGRRLGAAPRRHRWEAGATGTTPLLALHRDPGERLEGAYPWRSASQPINSRPVHRPHLP